MRNSSLKFSGMARVNGGDHIVLPASHVYPQVEWVIPAFTPSRRASLHFDQYSFSILLRDEVRVEVWVGLSGWLQTEAVYPPADGHPSQY